MRGFSLSPITGHVYPLPSRCQGYQERIPCLLTLYAPFLCSLSLPLQRSLATICLRPMHTTIRKQKYGRFFCLALFLAVAFVCSLYASRFFAIDDCLDRGGRWDYEIEECER